MALVTDKNFYMEKDLMLNLDFLLERNKKGWDNVIIIDGMERSGKSTIGRQIGYYLAYKRRKGFSAKNVFFDADKIFEYAMKTRGQTIIWDEAALGGMSEDRYKQVQQILIKMLMTAAKYHHNFIFIIPKIRKLSDYLAEDRSIALIRVLAVDNIERGYYNAYGFEKKNIISQMERRKQRHSCTRDFRGRFFSYEDKPAQEVLDIKEYELKKDEAIKRLKYVDKKQYDALLKLSKLVEVIKSKKLMTKVEMAREIGVDASFMSRLPRIK